MDGDDEAFEQLHAALAPLLRKRLQRTIADPALVEDLVQQSFLRAHVNRARLTELELDANHTIEGWYLTVARNVMLDAVRSRARTRRREATLIARSELEGLGCSTTPVTPEEAHLQREEDEHRRAWVREAVRRLPRGQREVIVLHKLRGLSLSSVAERLHVRPGAARVRAHRAYRNLAALLEDCKPALATADPSQPV